MTQRYRLDSRQGRFQVQGFATGMLSVFAHSPTFAVRDYRGEVRLDDGAPGRMTLDVTVRADSLSLVDRVKDADRHEIEDRMRREVLEVTTYPEIRYEAADIAARATGRGQFTLRINGTLHLHGLTRAQPIDAEMHLFEDGLRIAGGCPLRMPDYGIRPVTALGGTIRLKDELKVTFDLAGLPEAP
jgi:polyisoprenoid-binding protein YceI